MPSCHDVMVGLPPWVLSGSLTVAAASSLWLLSRGTLTSAGPSPWRFEVTSLRPVRWLVHKRWFQFALQVPLVAILGVILYAGVEGTPVADRNFATVVTWGLWWTLLIVDIVLLGRMWCLVCPWDALASWLRRLAFWRRGDEPLALDLPWPRWLRNVYPATILFVGLTWLELGYGVTMSPRATAFLGLAMVLMAVVPALFFEKKSFCKYGCLIGRICGLYSMLAPVELRSRDKAICAECKTKDCLTGNERGYPCPTGQCLTSMTTNTYCTVCTECIKSCPHDNVAINLRAWGGDLHNLRKPRKDEAILALVMLSLTSFHGLTMTPTWNELLASARAASGLGYLAAFTLGMVAILLLPGGLYLGLCSVAVRLPGWERRSLLGAPRRRDAMWAVASAYAYPLIAVALCYHLAHNAGHFLTEAAAIVPVLSDPLGSGQDLFGTASFVPRPLASMPTIWALMVLLVLLGHVWATRATRSSLERLKEQLRIGTPPRTSRWVMGCFVLMCTAANLWLLAQPMEMRTGL
ncbi:MAG: hypothetical protein KC731_21620 [Myxococcales bacterium]|nr:hypothetical protein [Myxococcales bacterium]